VHTDLSTKSLEMNRLCRILLMAYMKKRYKEIDAK